MNVLNHKAACLATVIFFAFSTVAMAQKFDSLKAVSELAAENIKYANALRSADSAGVANLYTADAKIMNSDRPSTIGRTAILHFFGNMIRHGVTNFSYTTIGLWGSDNDLIVEEGSAAFALTDGKVVVKGRYLLVWKRENGKLKIFRDVFVSDSE